MRAALELSRDEVRQAIDMYLLVKGYHLVENANVAGVIVEVEPADRKDLHVDPELRRLILNAYNREHYSYNQERIKRVRRAWKQQRQEELRQHYGSH